MNVHLEEPPENSALRDQTARNLSYAVELPKIAFSVLRFLAVWDPVLGSMGKAER